MEGKGYKKAETSDARVGEVLEKWEKGKGVQRVQREQFRTKVTKSEVRA